MGTPSSTDKLSNEFSDCSAIWWWISELNTVLYQQDFKHCRLVADFRARYIHRYISIKTAIMWLNVRNTKFNFFLFSPPSDVEILHYKNVTLTHQFHFLWSFLCDYCENLFHYHGILRNGSRWCGSLNL